MCNKGQELFQKNGPPQDMGKGLGGFCVLSGGDTELPKYCLKQRPIQHSEQGESHLLGRFWQLPRMGRKSG